MGSLIQFPSRHRRPAGGLQRPASGRGATIVACNQCGERHPIVRFAGGEERCVTAFFDGTHWFCRNRGCRRAWLESAER